MPICSCTRFRACGNRPPRPSVGGARREHGGDALRHRPERGRDVARLRAARPPARRRAGRRERGRRAPCPTLHSVHILPGGVAVPADSWWRAQGGRGVGPRPRASRCAADRLSGRSMRGTGSHPSASQRPRGQPGGRTRHGTGSRPRAVAARRAAGVPSWPRGQCRPTRRLVARAGRGSHARVAGLGTRRAFAARAALVHLGRVGPARRHTAA